MDVNPILIFIFLINKYFPILLKFLHFLLFFKKYLIFFKNSIFLFRILKKIIIICLMKIILNCLYV